MGLATAKACRARFHPFQRVLKRKNGQPTDLVFGNTQREMFNRVLEDLKLKYDRDGQVRTSYSLRHTYISFRLMEGADIYQIAKNCRTSVEMIEKYYASHIKNMIDAGAINVGRRGGASKTSPERQSETLSRTCLIYRRHGDSTHAVVATPAADW